jgi:hypothetical protein
LSIFGLATQAIIFALVALSWISRVNFPFELSLNILKAWYEVVGWAAVDNAIFAVAQFVLLCLAKHQRRGRVGSSSSYTRPNEEEPLLIR